MTDDTLISNDEDEKPLLADAESSESLSALSRSPSPEFESESESESESEPTDTRFVQPPVSRPRRTSLLIFVALTCWLAYYMRTNFFYAKRKANVIHASRYSKDYKFRPAASPVVTETLRDGRTRLRGALPEQTPILPAVKKQKKTRTGKASGSRNSKGKFKPRRP